MNALDRPLVFVDLETTGGVASADRITEIGIVEMDAHGQTTAWSSLVNPQAPIPPFIEKLTGISDEMVAQAPTFADLADEVMARLRGRMFVAHNARFDYGFLRHAFAREQRDFQATVLCTVKLSKRLFPQFGKHSLDALIERHQLIVPERHRALADARALAQYWHALSRQVEPAVLHEAVDALTGRGDWPRQLDLAVLETLPERHGAYALFDAQANALYVGKGQDVRQHLLAHFRAERRQQPARRHAHLVHRVEVHPAAGELEAALLEAALMRRWRPAYNRPGTTQVEAACTWLLRPAQEAGETASLELIAADALRWSEDEEAFGVFGTRREALKTLKEIAGTAQLCLAAMQIESAAPGAPCEGWRRGECSGACVGREPMQAHEQRLRRVLADWRAPHWPHAGPIAVAEQGRWHLLYRWRHLGTVDDLSGAGEVLRKPAPAFDRQVFRILAAFLARPEANPVGLAPSSG